MPTAYLSIPATQDTPEPLPPCGGSWVRGEDGSLTPGDDATAIAAGLMPAPADPAPTKPRAAPAAAKE